MRKSLRDSIVREAEAAKSLLDTIESENREASDVERDKIAEHLGKAKQIEDAGKSEDALREQFGVLTDGIKAGADLLDAAGNPIGKSAGTRGESPAGPSGAGAVKSLGQRFVDSAEFSAMLKTAGPSGFSEKSSPKSLPWNTKALITGLSDTSSGALIQNDFRGLLDPFYQRPLTIKDLFSQGTTASDLIEYVKLTSVTNNAAPVAEATSSAFIDGTTVTTVAGGLKPESGMVFARETVPVRTIAHWIPVTKRSLSDAPQIRSMIDSFLRYGLDEELEDQLISGNGTGENLTGLNSVSGIQTQAAPGGGQTILDTLRMARRKVRIGGRANPTGYVLNPIDWEAIELMKDGNAQYYAGGPFSMRAPTLWGLPVVESEAVAAGTAWVADWRYGIFLDREQASIQVTDSHADFFTRNLVAILAEMRGCLAVTRPQAFVKVTLA